jgi:hypothetical protein
MLRCRRHGDKSRLTLEHIMIACELRRIVDDACSPPLDAGSCTNPGNRSTRSLDCTHGHSSPPRRRRPEPRPETEAEHQARLAWEAKGIAEARAQVDAGFYVDAAEVDAWINSIGTDHELAPPPTRRR